jgi:hypothetical protein
LGNGLFDHSNLWEAYFGHHPKRKNKAVMARKKLRTKGLRFVFHYNCLQNQNNKKNMVCLSFSAGSNSFFKY